MARYIGIRHRVKQTKEGEARPTMVALVENEHVQVYELEDDTAELDFLLGRFPTGYRRAADSEDLSAFLPRHVRLRKDGDKMAKHVPVAYEGLKASDVVAMALGGSGDRLAYALSRRAEEIGAAVHRLPPFLLKLERGSDAKDDDHLLLARLVQMHPDYFYAVGPRDREFIAMRVCYNDRRDTMKDRIRCEQRLLERVKGKVFLSEEGRYPEGKMEDEYLAAKASDVILASVLAEEARREAELRRAVHRLDIWQEIFLPVKGVGEVLAAGIMTHIADIRMFPTAPKLKKYCGVHVLADGRFPRKRTGEVASWVPQARQALFLLGEQFVYQATSPWGVKLRQYKANLRAKHPVVECSTCGVPWEQCSGGKAATRRHAKRYSDGHIHKMALWRTRTRFVEWLWREWTRLEEAKQAK